MKKAEQLKAEVTEAAEDMSFLLMNPSKPNDKPWRVIHVETLVQRILPLCEFVRKCESSEDKEFAERARFALQCFLSEEGL